MTPINRYAELITAQKKLIRKESIKFVRDIPSLELAQIGAYHLAQHLVYTEAGFAASGTTTNIVCDIADSIKPGLDGETKFLLGWNACILPLIKAGIVESTNRYEIKAKSDRSKEFQMYHKVVSRSKSKNKSPNKVIVVLDEEFIIRLTLLIPEASVIKPEATLFRSPPQHWQGFYNSDLGKLINHCNKNVIGCFSWAKNERLFQTINKIQDVSLSVNSDVLRVVIELKDQVYPHKFDDKKKIYTIGKDKLSKKALIGKLREIDGTINQAIIAEGSPFYSAIKPEYRGRLNYCLPYLNYGGSDIAKGLIRSTVGKALGVKGWDILMISTINHLGEDKLSRVEKLELADTMLDDFIRIGSNPYKNKEWMKADKPVQFLAHVMEIAKAVNDTEAGLIESEYDFISHIFCGVDQATSGPAHIGTATQDPSTLLYTNLLKDKDRQDLYLSVGRVVRRKIKAMIQDVSSEVVMPDDLDAFYKALWYSKNRDEVINECIAKFYAIIEEDKILRKFNKRSNMIIGHSAEEWCIAGAIWDDFHAEYEWMTPPFCKALADVIYDSYGEVLPACKEFMVAMKKLASIVHKKSEQLYIESQWDNFPLMQNYYTRDKIDVEVRDPNNKSGWSTYVVEQYTDKHNYNDSASGIAPNIIHGLGDAVLLRKTVHDFDHPIAVNHDGVYCLAADYDELSSILRINQTLMANEFNIINQIAKFYPEVNDLAITVNDVHPEFDPINNEFCFA